MQGLHTPHRSHSIAKSCSPLADCEFALTDQLVYQCQAWQSDPSRHGQIDKEGLSSGDEVDSDMTTNQEQGGMTEEALKDID